MITLAAGFDYLDRLQQPNASLFAWAVLSVLALGAPLATLTGYILVSLELAPLKVMVLGIGTIPAAFLLYFALQFPFPAHLPIVRWVYLGVFVGCGLVVFAIGLLRFGLGIWRKS